MIEGPNIQFPQGAGYLAGERGTTAEAVKDISEAVEETIIDTEDFEGGVAGTGTWEITTSSPHAGVNCLRSAVITHNQNSDQTFTVPAMATSLRFWRRVSSEAGFDFFRVYKDSISAPNLLYETSGTTNTWAQQTVALSGATSIIFRYIKDGSASSGLDAAFIDDLEWIIPGVAAVQIYEPLLLDSDNRLKVTLLDQVVAVSGTIDVNFPAELEISNDAGNPIPVTGTVDANILNFPAEFEIINDIGNPIPVTGTVEVSNFPSEFEISNDVGNPIPVTGTVDANILNFPTDFEISNDIGNPIPVTGTIEVSNFPAEFEIINDIGNPIPVTGTVAVSNFPNSVEVTNDVGNPLPVSGTVSVADRFAPSSTRQTLATTISSAGNNTIVTPALGNKIRLHWIGLSSSENNQSEVLATVKFGAVEHYRWYMGAPGIFSHWETIDGETDEPLVVNLSGGESVQVNFTYQEVT